MLDRAWEQWSRRTAPLVARNEKMLAAGLDPACKGCVLHHRTSGKYMMTHTCEREVRRLDELKRKQEERERRKATREAGKVDMYTSLTKEEFDRLPPLSEDEFARIDAAGRAARDTIMRRSRRSRRP